MQTINYLNNEKQPVRLGLLLLLLVRTLVITVLLCAAAVAVIYYFSARSRFPAFPADRAAFANIDSVFCIRWYGVGGDWEKRVYKPSAHPADMITSMPDEPWQRLLGVAGKQATLPGVWSDPETQTFLDFAGFLPTLETLTAPKMNDITAFNGVIIHGHDAAGGELIYLCGLRIPRAWGEYVDAVIVRADAKAKWTVVYSKRFDVGEDDDIFYSPLVPAIGSLPILVLVNLAMLPLSISQWKRRRLADLSGSGEISKK